MLIILSLCLEGAFSLTLGALTPDLVLVIIILSAFYLSEAKGIFLAFLSGLLVDLRWEPIIGLSSIYFILSYYIFSLMVQFYRRRLNYLTNLFACIMVFSFFQVFKMAFYHILGIEYEVSYLILTGRVIVDVFIFLIGFIFISRKSGGVTA